ncbi:hypothetical protein CcaCcLH18_10252 [Colletotrichum camelliae]|nr:hypothetical protein CcaCcLH18_10252 [Colletotrichum camelliae]
MDDHIAEHLMHIAKISFFGMSFWPDETSEGASIGQERNLSVISQHSDNLSESFSTASSFDSNPNSNIEHADYGPEESFEFLRHSPSDETSTKHSVAREDSIPTSEMVVSESDGEDQDDGQKTAISKLITTLDFSAKHVQNLEIVREGTQKDFFQRAEFKRWLHNEGNMLFCPGLPYSGIGIAYVFCDFRLEDEQNCREILASILKQLFLSQKYPPESHHATRSLKRRLQDTDEALSTTEVAEHICAIASMLDKVYILVDGIDGCPRNKGDRHALISSVMSLRKVCQFSLFVTSRYIPEFTRYFEEAEVIPIRASRDDVSLCARTSRQPPKDWRLAEFVLQWLSISREEVMVPQLLDAAAILWITPADELISIDAILSACQGLVEVDKKRNVFSFSLMSIEESFQLCSGPKAEEIVARICIRCLTLGIIVWPPIWDSPKVKEQPPEESFRATIRNGPLHEYALRYWGYHAQRAQVLPDPIMTFLNSEDAIADVFEALWTSGHFRCPLWARKYNFRPHEVTGLHLAAYYGVTGSILDQSGESLLLVPQLSRGLRSGDEGDQLRHFLGGGNVNVKDSIGWTPLLYATFSDTLKPISDLLAIPGIEADCKDSCGRTPFSYAAEEEDQEYFLEKMVLLLHEGRVKPDSKDNNLRTPLSYAAEWGRERIVKHLLATSRVKPDSVDKFGRTPFSYAAERGHQVLLHLLLEKGIKVDSKDQHRRTPLSHAAGAGSVAEARFLVEQCAANPRSKDVEGKTPLYYAAAAGHEAMVKLLLFQKAWETCLDIKDESGKRPLDIAFEKHGAEHSVTKFLSEKMAQNEEARTRTLPGARWFRGVRDRLTDRRR